MKQGFSHTLNKYVTQSGYTPGQLAALTGLPQATIVNWLTDRVKKPHQWTGLLKLAEVLHLNEAEVTDLLHAAGYPSIAELAAHASDQEQHLLDPWRNQIHQRNHSPFQAVADLPYFVGRQTELKALQQYLMDTSERAICSIQGMAGIGKTALAARAAYALRPYFPDGVLWARVDKADTSSILEAFANAYQHDVSHYPDIASRSQVVRDILAHKRALIVFDNAQSSDQIRPLLPPSDTCAVIITSRHRDLAITHGSDRINLDLFDAEASYQLFEAILGVEQAYHQKETLLAIAELVEYLPLAINIVATRIAYEPGWSSEAFLRRLDGGSIKLDVLADEANDIRRIFIDSYRALAPSVRDFLGVLANTRKRMFDLELVADLTQTPHDRAHDYLRALHSVSLVDFCGDDCYSIHALIREFAQDNTRNPNLPLE